MPEAFSFFPADESFDFETWRNIGVTAYYGADLGEVCSIMPQLKARDLESWNVAWTGLARRIEERAHKSDPKTASGKVSMRNALFRAATYYRAADFYLHGNPNDPRIKETWVDQARCFDKAIALLPIPGVRFKIPTSLGFHVPGIFFSAAPKHEGPRPILLLGNGFDGSPEEMLHVAGFASLERGFHVLCYEGPGQTAVRRFQNKGFIHDWEKVVTPVVDFLDKHASDLGVDMKRIGLFGYSLGGYLALRAAAFEKRIKATILVGAVWNVKDAFRGPFYEAIYAEDFQRATDTLSDPSQPTGKRWQAEHAMWVMFDEGQNVDQNGKPRYTALIDHAAKFAVEDFIDEVDCKVFVTDSEEELFFPGDAKKVMERLGEDKGTFHMFKSVDGAGIHCQFGATQNLTQESLDWFEKVVA